MTRLDRLSLSTFKARCTRSDCIQYFKIISRREEVCWQQEPGVIAPRYSRRKRPQREVMRNGGQRFNFFTIEWSIRGTIFLTRWQYP